MAFGGVIGGDRASPVGDASNGGAVQPVNPGFEWLPSTYAGRVYAACRRSGIDGELPYPHHGQWGATLPLAKCGAEMRAHATLVKG
jgi:hypothetical protein